MAFLSLMLALCRPKRDAYFPQSGIRRSESRLFELAVLANALSKVPEPMVALVSIQ